MSLSPIILFQLMADTYQSAVSSCCIVLLFSVHYCKLLDLFNSDGGYTTLSLSYNKSTARFGSVITIKCNKNYQTSNSTRTCTLDGWSGTNPSCGKFHHLTNAEPLW